jgi:hypothetical protein
MRTMIAGGDCTRERLLEANIKIMVLQHLRSRRLLSANTPITSEFFVDGLRRRADLAAFGRIFTAVEIKSEADTLVRLPAQLETFKKFFDRVFLVVAEKHADRAASIAHADVGIWSLGGGVITELRAATTNPCIGKKNMARLLTISEMRKANSKYSTRPDGQRRRDHEAAVERLSEYRLRAVVRDSMRLRFKELTANFWATLDDARTPRQALDVLSRSATRRRTLMEEREARSAFWSAWSRSAVDTLLASSGPTICDSSHSSHRPFGGPYPEVVHRKLEDEDVY